MRAHFLSKIVSQSLSIDRMRARSIMSRIVSKLLMPHAELKSERPSEDIFGDPLPKMRIEGEVAVIPIVGVLMMCVPSWAKQLGLDVTDANDIEEELATALNNPEVRLIALECDSPGGWSLAGDKLFDIIEAADKKKPVMAYCGDGRDMASACFNAAAGARSIYCGRYALAIGSIGSFWSMMDDTEFWKQMGVTWEVFRSGEMKGILEDPLSEPQREYLQAMTDEYGARIRRNVKKRRGDIKDADLQGQWFDGMQAAERGFVNANAPTLNEAIKRFRRTEKL